MSAIDIQVGENIRSLRTLHGKSQRETAKSVGVSYQQLHKYETGRNRLSVSTLISLGEVFDVEGRELLPTNDNPLGGLQLIHRSLELHRAFQSITDPAKRELVLSIVRALAP